MGPHRSRLARVRRARLRRRSARRGHRRGRRSRTVRWPGGEPGAIGWSRAATGRRAPRRRRARPRRRRASSTAASTSIRVASWLRPRSRAARANRLASGPSRPRIASRPAFIEEVGVDVAAGFQPPQRQLRRVLTPACAVRLEEVGEHALQLADAQHAHLLANDLAVDRVGQRRARAAAVDVDRNRPRRSSAATTSGPASSSRSASPRAPATASSSSARCPRPWSSARCAATSSSRVADVGSCVSRHTPRRRKQRPLLQ